VESDWFRRRLDGQPIERLTGSGGDPDGSWAVGDDETAEDVIARYQEACDRSREVASRYALEDSVPHPRLGRVSLRWIYVHMIEETARHAGHADILREQLDGAVGTEAGSTALHGRDTTFWEIHRAKIERAAKAADPAPA